jgi:hypothetical protein
MTLEQIGEVLLPTHDNPGGFDHAAVHGPRGRLYVAHTANDALDVVDCATNTFLGSIPRLEGVAGALVSEEHDLVFTSNRAENTECPSGGWLRAASGPRMRDQPRWRREHDPCRPLRMGSMGGEGVMARLASLKPRRESVHIANPGLFPVAAVGLALSQLLARFGRSSSTIDRPPRR